MLREITRPSPAQLRHMASSSMDPIVQQALRDLADEYERTPRQTKKPIA